MKDSLLDVVGCGLETIDLGRQYRVGMPQSPNHPHFWHTLPRRHGDMTRPDGASAANDMISMGTHVGTHTDAVLGELGYSDDEIDALRKEGAIK